MAKRDCRVWALMLEAGKGGVVDSRFLLCVHIQVYMFRYL